LHDTVPALFWLAAAAYASIWPTSEFGAWYTMMLACGATPPDCSTSRLDSCESYLAPNLAPPSTLSSLIRFGLTVMPTSDQKWYASDGCMAARVMMPRVWPWPCELPYSGVRLYWLANCAGVRSPK